MSCPSTGGSHQGQRQADLVLEALERRPAKIIQGVLKARLACTGGDGAVVRGGPEARHSSSGAAHLIWNRVRDDQQEGLTLWGHFHRSDRALHFASTKWVEEVVDMGKELNRLFGVNAGKVGPHRKIFRSVDAAWLFILLLPAGRSFFEQLGKRWTSAQWLWIILVARGS